jgi:hypothetical protein
MASQQIIESVALNGPENWETWDTQFKAKAVASDLWDLINPTSSALEAVLFATKPGKSKTHEKYTEVPSNR